MNQAVTFGARLHHSADREEMVELMDEYSPEIVPRSGLCFVFKDSSVGFVHSETPTEFEAFTSPYLVEVECVNYDTHKVEHKYVVQVPGNVDSDQIGTKAKAHLLKLAREQGLFDESRYQLMVSPLEFTQDIWEC